MIEKIKQIRKLQRELSRAYGLTVLENMPSQVYDLNMFLGLAEGKEISEGNRGCSEYPHSLHYTDQGEDISIILTEEEYQEYKNSRTAMRLKENVDA